MHTLCAHLTTFAHSLKQPREAEGIRVLAKYLKRGKQASTASPAVLLLDSVMRVMDPRSGLPLGVRRMVSPKLHALLVAIVTLHCTGSVVKQLIGYTYSPN